MVRVLKKPKQMDRKNGVHLKSGLMEMLQRRKYLIVLWFIDDLRWFR